MPQRLIWTLAAALAICTGAPLAWADITPSNLFSDNAVLQRDVKLAIFGTTDKPEKVTVRFAGQEASAEPSNGQWSVELKPLPANSEPGVLTITQGDAKVERKNILVGDVWVCGGQSNMQWGVNQSAGAAEAISAANDPLLRLFTVPRDQGIKEPRATVVGNWSLTSPESVPGFSAVGYYFGLDLQKSLNVPIGLINSNIGGTTAERWISKEALTAKKELEGISSPQGANDLWNAMIFPLLKFPIRGAIWYQGESNAERAWQYRTLFPEMIKCWRDGWGLGEFPFLVVQLAPFEAGQAVTKDPVDSNWAELREAQLFTSQTVPNVGLAVITDLGDPKDIHPQRKREVGERLALAAKAIAYGQNVAHIGPVFEKQTIDGDKIVLNFKSPSSGLVAKEGDLQGFTIAGEDKQFHVAQAKIEGDKVVVSSDKVPHPVAVRYGWANYPIGNLWGSNGLPATPFRTDDFPATTKDRK